MNIAYTYIWRKTDLSVVASDLKSTILYRQRNFDYNDRIVWIGIHYLEEMAR